MFGALEQIMRGKIMEKEKKVEKENKWNKNRADGVLTRNKRNKTNKIQKYQQIINKQLITKQF